MVLLLISLLASAVMARPSANQRVIFTEDSVSSEQCRVEASEVFWLEDGGCYVLGERGPCQPGQTLKLTNSRPGCVPLSPKMEEQEEKLEEDQEQKPKEGEGEKEEQEVVEVVELEVEEVEKEDVDEVEVDDEKCHQSWQVKVADSPGCHSLLTRGPCEAESWVVLEPGSLTGRCEVRRCEEEEEVWLASQCRCLDQDQAASHCGHHAGLVWTPLAEGICACDQGYLADTEGTCHQLGSRGPCLQHQVWLNQTDGRPHCADNNDTVRIFELLSSKSTRGGSNTAQSRDCYVDETGRCRKIIKIGGRFGEHQQQQQESFQDWLAGFTPSDWLCSPGGLEPCEGEEGEEGVMWSDGKCYQLATTGPCPPAHWLVLDQDTQPRCQPRHCGEEEVLWAPSCSCFPLQTNTTLRLKSDLASPCQDGERLVVSPYGDGLCLYQEHQEEREEREEETGTLQFRISELLSSKSCYIDENGRCRQPLNIRKRLDDGVRHDALQDLLAWLEQFPKPSRECGDVAGGQHTAEKSVRMTESDCHREGKILFEDGNCYNLLERGPCFQQSMWVVMALQTDGSLAAECRPRKCISNDTIWDPESCQCYDTAEVGPCAPGERLYQDIFGGGVCGCKEGFEVWAETGDCHQVGERGPCGEGETFTFNEVTHITNCSDTETTTRVFDIIPSSNNIMNMNKVTKETCVLDAKGKCRRKINIKRSSPELSQSAEFKSWLESFIVRSPEKFLCADLDL